MAQLLLDREGVAVALELGVELPVPVWLPVGLLLAGPEADQLGLWLPEPEPLAVLEAEEPWDREAVGLREAEEDRVRVEEGVPLPV